MTVLDRTGHGETGKRPIAVITKKMVAEKELRPKWRCSVAATDSFALTPGASLGNHSIYSYDNDSGFDLV